VIPRRPSLQLGLGVEMLWLGTRQPGCNLCARLWDHRQTNPLHHCFCPCPALYLTHGITGDMTILPDLVPKTGLIC